MHYQHFIKLFEELRSECQRISGFNLSPGEYNCQQRLYRKFYDEGYARAKQDILDVLQLAYEAADDSKPKTMYNSDKFKHAIRLIEQSKML